MTSKGYHDTDEYGPAGLPPDSFHLILQGGPADVSMTCSPWEAVVAVTGQPPTTWYVPLAVVPWQPGPALPARDLFVIPLDASRIPQRAVYHLEAYTEADGVGRPRLLYRYGRFQDHPPDMTQPHPPADHPPTHQAPPPTLDIARRNLAARRRR